jgi:hypothetical protein
VLVDQLEELPAAQCLRLLALDVEPHRELAIYALEDDVLATCRQGFPSLRCGHDLGHELRR